MGAPVSPAATTAPRCADVGGRRRYQPELDGIRGLAVIAVLLFHAGHLRGGFLGVDLFFTLSGFLITRLLLIEHAERGRVSLKGFWSARARRLLPALYLVLAATVAYVALWAREDSLARVRRETFAALAYVANWYSIATGGDYWDQFAAPSPLDHLWSLAVEEQFYFVWPLILIAVLAWRGRPTLLAIAVTMAVASAGLMAALSSPTSSRVYFGTDTRASSILVGAAAALVVELAPPGPIFLRDGRASRTLGAAGVVAMLGLIAAWVTVDGAATASLYRGGFFLHALGAAVVIVAVTAQPWSVLGRTLGSVPLNMIGVMSYGLYLWHWPVYLVLTGERTDLVGWRLTIIRIIVTATLALASFVMIEAPIRAGRLRSTALVAAGLVGIGALVGSMVLVTRPVSSTVRVSARKPVVAAVPPTAAPVSLLRTVPHLGPESPIRLRTPTVDDPLRVLLIGDSYMYDAQPGIAAALEATGVVVPTPAGFPGFRITDGPWVDSLLTIAAEEQPELVVAMWAHFDVSWLADHGPDEFSASLRNMLVGLVSGGAAVAIIGLAPSALSTVDGSFLDRDINAVFRTMAGTFPGRVLYVDPDPVVAPDGVARLTIDGPAGPLRVRKTDLAHFCPDGAARFGQAMTELLRPLAGIPEPDPTLWQWGSWRQDARYHEPAGLCG